MLEGSAPPPAPPPPPPGALSQDRVAAVREMSMKPAPTRVDVSISCNLLGLGITSSSSYSGSTSTAAVIQTGISSHSKFKFESKVKNTLFFIGLINIGQVNSCDPASFLAPGSPAFRLCLLRILILLCFDFS